MDYGLWPATCRGSAFAELNKRCDFGFWTCSLSVSKFMKSLQLQIHSVPAFLKIVCIGIVMSTNIPLIYYNDVALDLVARVLVCLLISALLWTAKSFVWIRFDKNTISEGYSILGVRVLTLYKSTFTGFEKIYINYVGGGSSTIVLQRTTDSRISTAARYKAFLKTYEGDKFCIAEDSIRTLILRRVDSIAAAVNCPVYDNTDEQGIF